MDRLVEREPAGRGPVTAAPALAVQFFLIPFGVIVVTVLIYAGFRVLLADDRTVQDYLNEIQNGGSDRRWPAAYELSRRISDPKVRAANPGLGPALVKAFHDSKSSDPLVRRYLALALGRLDPPLPPDAVPLLTEALTDPDSETRISAIWALGSIGDAIAAPALMELYASDDPGIRKMTVYALGALPGDPQVRTLQTALGDPATDVKWNAAVALARHGKRDGLPVLRDMLDRAHVERHLQKAGGSSDEDRAGEVMISSLRAVASLKAGTLREPVLSLSRQDPSMRVRQAALEALKMMG
ncbi:MAG: HEAT repeat domain-containing protein [Acidobacteria bacterium]|nr:HEAT repeat domain-containing protein [Acidobacteriota bacterium]